jgi:thioredoxin-like negative regulator of GroEL
MQKLTSSTFDQVVEQSNGKVIIKFAADWCPDCRRVEGAYEQFPAKHPDLFFAEVDSQEEQALAERFDLRGIPSFLVFQSGELVDRLYSRDAKTVKAVEEFVTNHRG